MKAQRTKPTVINGLEGYLKEFVYSIATIANSVIPKKNIISMCSFPDFTDNTRALYEYMQQCEDTGLFEGCKIIWHVKNPDTARKRNDALHFNKFQVEFVKKNHLKSFLAFCQSKYIFSTHGLFSMVKLTGKQTNFNLWHGMPIKNIGFTYEDDIRTGIVLGDYYFVTSKYFKDIFKLVFHAPSARCFITGQPRTDLMFRGKLKKEVLVGHKVEGLIMYLPTYRTSSTKNKGSGVALNSATRIMGGTVGEWEIINTALKSTNQIMIVKPHPMEASSDYDKISHLSNVKIVDEEWMNKKNYMLYDLLGCVDKLITDYSSVYVDFLLLNRPICFFVPDYESYGESRGFISKDQEQLFPGTKVVKFSELKDFITAEDNYSKERQVVSSLFNSIKGGESCKLIIRKINEAMRLRERT